MTKDEFNQWFEYHTSRFTSLKGRLESESLKAWFQCLRSVDFEEACKISDDMFSGVEDPPRWVDSHPRAIRAISNKRQYGEANTHREHPEKPRERFIDGQQVFDCAKCEDSGWLTAWHPIAVEAARKGVFKKEKHILTCAIGCDCSWGKRNAELLNDPPPMVDDSWIIVSGITSSDEEINKLFA